MKRCAAKERPKTLMTYLPGYVMPEVWLSYGTGHSVLDIKSENLRTVFEIDPGTVSEESLDESLADVLSGTLVILQNTPSVHQIISHMYKMCEQRSLPFPTILTDRYMIPSLRGGLPEGCRVDSFQGTDSPDADMIFVSEIIPDGLFGYESACTRLLRRFGEEMMLKAYKNRVADTPSPASSTPSYEIAQKFADRFEVKSIDILGGRDGIRDMHVGHPASSDITRLADRYMQQGRHAFSSVIGSVGDVSASSTLSGSLPSLWNLWLALKSGGRAVLLAECGMGLGSEALRQYTEGRLTTDHLHHPSQYISGMEGLLFLESINEKVDITLVSALPQMYESSLSMNFVRMSQHVIDEIVKDNPRHKITIIPDASRILLGQYSSRDGGADNG
ncbi:MAG: transcriptional regulator [Cenarchaeum sp. SB0661_bin_35]|nr:transcriptional regulator [Cenarchaeum sp. SB0667_bin_13]MXZ92923.1 transcriptional regulator [Cenarchaeum sp. SB0666_bin_15]MYC79180.1 transcriptional regulator [Cenarchaeum sp. SB0661_bin_35]MYD59237.1 transcriptional regulator [Cenarchaeum sp. SB0678_bin_8]MYI51293.1 transcriptional regulator [Cenarchaeum sp. SB0673_bin_9]MYJ27199.1 transcriptional regulator [Cenarchaeum sp. SB0672_bin_9]